MRVNRKRRLIRILDSAIAIVNPMLTPITNNRSRSTYLTASVRLALACGLRLASIVREDKYTPLEPPSQAGKHGWTVQTIQSLTANRNSSRSVGFAVADRWRLHAVQHKRLHGSLVGRQHDPGKCMIFETAERLGSSCLATQQLTLSGYMILRRLTKKR